ncbi:MAG: NTP transferase domain-containing protein [Candidatus Kerfeldbacteria bacterium]|nr:NTP transferase domain-containing protein [Candidatus Kerfeldbacteria bacterium]
MITKVVISAAGRGTRMKHLSQRRPKHLIEVGGKPFLNYVLENVRAAGLTDITIVSGYFSDQIESFLKTVPYPVRVMNQFELLGTEEYGTACPIKVVRDVIGTDQFIALAGDNYYEVSDITKMIHEDEFTYVGAKTTDHPETKGVLVTDADGILESIVEKPATFMGNLVNGSAYKFTHDIFDVIDDVPLSSRGEYEITDAITALAALRKVKVVKIDGYWIDFGNPDDIHQFEQYLSTRQ